MTSENFQTSPTRPTCGLVAFGGGQEEEVANGKPDGKTSFNHNCENCAR